MVHVVIYNLLANRLFLLCIQYNIIKLVSQIIIQYEDFIIKKNQCSVIYVKNRITCLILIYVVWLLYRY